MAVMLYVRNPLSLRNVEDLLFERCIDICHETVVSSNRFSSLAPIRRRPPPLSRLPQGALLQGRAAITDLLLAIGG
jgi:hypothetical protein